MILQDVDYLEKVAGLNPLNVTLYYIAYGIIVFGLVLLLIFALIKYQEGSKMNNAIAASISKTIGLFFLIASITLTIFYVDRFYIYFHQGTRWLAEHDDSNTLVAYDYFYVAIITMASSVAILHYPLEKYILGKENYPLSKFIIATLFLLPFPRFFEARYGIVASFIFFGIPMLAAVIGLLHFIAQYLKLAMNSPKGSEIRSKSISIILGFILFVTGTFVTTNLSKKTASFMGEIDLKFFAPIGPLVFLTGILLLWKGYKPNKDSA